MIFKDIKIALFLLVVSVVMACGTSGGGSSDGDDEGEEETEGSGGEDESDSRIPQTVIGSIKDDVGIFTGLYKWIIVFVERDTGITKIAQIDRVGNYSITGLATNRPQTIVLLDSKYRLQAVLSYSEATEKIKQYFLLEGETMPPLIQSGSKLEFSDFTSITLCDQTASDSDKDGIPDGMETGQLKMTESIATDNGDTKVLQMAALDGETETTTALNPDIDSDGIINYFDSDDDGDGTIDVFDSDANGNSIADGTEQNSELYFSYQLHYLVVQTLSEVQDDDSLKISLILTAKLQDDADPPAGGIKVIGPSSLFQNAQVYTINQQTGDAVMADWDMTLADDGLNQDLAANDGVYSRTVVLAANKVPEANQALFIQLVGAESSSNIEFPFAFPALTLGTITGSFAVSNGTQTLTLGGTQFKNYLDDSALAGFNWSAHIFDSESIKVFSSELIAGTETTYTLSDKILEEGETYSGFVATKSLARILGYPLYIFKSSSITISLDE